MASTEALSRSSHPYHMYDAIFAQPAGIRQAMRESAGDVASVAAALRSVEHLAISGIGTSWHAALVAELLFAHFARFAQRVRTFHSFELKSYWPSPDRPTALIVVSHGGNKRYAREALEQVKRCGGVGVAVTGKGIDALNGADHVLHTVEHERSGAHTVGYTAALAVLAALAAEVGEDAELRGALDGVSDQVATLLGEEAWDELTARFADRRVYWFIGGGPNAATAYEAALKMAEASHAIAHAFDCEQFLHGPWAAMEREDVLVLVAPPGPSYERCLAAARLATELGTPILAIVQRGDVEIAPLAARTVAVPRIDELLSPILTVVPLQLLAYYTAIARRTNPDTMRNEDPRYARARSTLKL